MNAYDYQAQKWVTGEEAKKLLAQQNAETLTLLKSEKGEAYAKFINMNRAEMIATLERVQ